MVYKLKFLFQPLWQLTGRLFAPCAIWLCCSLLVSCSQLRSNKPDILLVFVEGMGESSYICSDELQSTELLELSQLCPRFLRYTRAFVPSTMTQPNLATIFSGQPIRTHKVVHNGKGALKARVNTLAEVAISKGYRTGFFSGGLPILNKFGIHQGFEVFSDGFSRVGDEPIEEKTLKASDRFSNWLSNEVGRGAFFAALYVPTDLQTFGPKTTEASFSKKAKWHSNFLESMNRLVKTLKEKRRLDNTLIVVTGVSGDRKNLELIQDQIDSSHTHVSFQVIAPGIKKGGTRNGLISIAKIYDLVAETLAKRIDYNTFPGYENAIVEVQSHWGVWRNRDPFPALGFRMDPYLLTFTPELNVFDSHADASEKYPLTQWSTKAVNAFIDLRERLGRPLEEPCFQTQLSDPQKPFKSIGSCKQKKTSLATRNRSVSTFFNTRNDSLHSDGNLKEVLWKQWKDKRLEEKSLLLDWLIQNLLFDKKWERLKEIAMTLKSPPLLYVALKNLDQTTESPQKGCLAFFADLKKDVESFYKTCEELSLLRVVKGLRRLKNNEKPEDSFWREVHVMKALREAKNRNLMMDLVNDVPGSDDLSYSLSELFFYLPEYKDFLGKIESKFLVTANP